MERLEEVRKNITEVVRRLKTFTFGVADWNELQILSDGSVKVLNDDVVVNNFVYDLELGTTTVTTLWKLVAEHSCGKSVSKIVLLRDYTNSDMSYSTTEDGDFVVSLGTYTPVRREPASGEINYVHQQPITHLIHAKTPDFDAIIKDYMSRLEDNGFIPCITFKMFNTIWQNSCKGTPDVGLDVVTTSYTVIVSDINGNHPWAVYWDNDFGYFVKNPNEKFIEDIKNWRILPTNRAEEYEKNREE